MIIFVAKWEDCASALAPVFTKECKPLVRDGEGAKQHISM